MHLPSWLAVRRLGQSGADGPFWHARLERVDPLMNHTQTSKMTVFEKQRPGAIRRRSFFQNYTRGLDACGRFFKKYRECANWHA